jgi:uncharacterized protein (TIGR02611 family)
VTSPPPRHPSLVLALKVASISIGSLLLLLGLVMLVTPGPGVLVILAGLAMLSPHSRWAKSLLVWTKQKFHIRHREPDDDQGARP